MSEKFSGGCEHINTHSSSDPIDNHTCHCSVCKRVTGQPTTHVAFFNHGDLEVESLEKLNKQLHQFQLYQYLVFRLLH